MECRKCGLTVSESDTYCSQCGERLDGKKQCPACQNFVNENDVFCSFCGKRVDGKTVCSKCGAVYEGNFCAVCGEKRVEKVVTESAKKQCGWEKFKKIERYLTPSLALGAIFILFICSFFVGFTLKVEASGECLAETLTTFDFFGKTFENLEAQLRALKSSINPANYNIAEIYSKIPYIIIAIAVGVNLAVCTAMLIVASVKVGTGFSKGNEVKINSCLATAYACFFITSLIAFSAVAVVNLLNVIITTMSVGSTAGLIISGIIIIAIVALRKIALGKQGFNSANICKTICIGLTVIVSIIAGVLVSKSFVRATGASVSFDFASSAYLQLVVLLITNASATAMQIKSIMAPSIISHVICLVALVCVGLLLYFTLSALLNDKPKKGRISILITSILVMLSIVGLLIMSVNGVELVTAILTKLNIKLTLRTIVIAPLVLSVIMVATAIVNAVGVSGKENEQTE